MSARVQRKTPRRLVLTTRSQSSIDEILDERLGEDAGVVDEDIDPAEPGKRRLRHRPHALLVAHIGLDEQGFAAVLADAGEDLGGMFFGHSVGDDEVGALRARRRWLSLCRFPRRHR